MAAAAAIPDADELTPPQWANVLDRIENALSAIVPPRMLAKVLPIASRLPLN